MKLEKKFQKIFEYTSENNSTFLDVKQIQELNKKLKF